MSKQNAKSLNSHLECSRCGQRRSIREIVNLCECGSPLLVRYRLKENAVSRDELAGRPFELWRYHEVLPDCRPVTLGEGGTPLLPLPKIAREAGLESLWVKEESVNPTGSFKARGLGVAVSMARELGVEALAIPSAGNAGSALAAYGAAAGLPVHVFLPTDTPALFVHEAESFGAVVHPVSGTIRDCAREMQGHPESGKWFDVSTLKEPYRIEGKKTLGYEIAEQMNWRVPDWILYPTGGGTGLIGMVKAFSEMEALGWIGSHRPHMVAVQAAGCAPIVRAFEKGEERAAVWENPQTKAWGLRVPAAIGDFLILRSVRETGGTAVAVSEEEMNQGARLLSTREGISACPEGGATVAALLRLTDAGRIRKHEQVVIFNTGTGLKYIDNPGTGT